MCGIAGFITSKIFDYDSVLNSMAAELKVRGPDDYGSWTSENIGFCHTRLSIVDLTVAGHQPMTSSDKRYVITFNGEIYNYEVIRSRLRSYKVNWIGNSDTEVLLAAIQFWGVEKTLQEISGMFAFAVYDRAEDILILARDRFGEKPLYFYNNNNDFVFSSELRPFYKFPGIKFEISKVSLSLYLKHSNVPAPHSIYKNISKLEAAQFIVYDCKSRNLTKRKYWSNNELYKSNLETESEGRCKINVLDDILTSAIGRQMCADVPLGAFLSGGIDSTTVVALMQKQSSEKVKTFSIGFDDPLYDESEHARLIAKHLNTEHYDLRVSGQDSLDVIPFLPLIYDEPFSDSSQIPTYLVSCIAKEKVKVALTGDGGDEIFGGYDRYKIAQKSWSKISNLSIKQRVFIAELIKKIPIGLLSLILKPGALIGVNPMLADKLNKLACVLGSENRVDFYFNTFLSHDFDDDSWVKDIPSSDHNYSKNIEDGLSFLQEMMLLDKMFYLPNDNLVKVDRAAMSVSLETRCPFLDPDVVSFSARLSDDYKIRGDVSKWILRQVLYKYVPEKIIEKPKSGFSVPLSSWLKGPLREWAEEMLDEKKMNADGLFNAELIRRRWHEHLGGKRNWQYQIWDVLIFQAWLNANRDIISFD